MSFSDVCPIIFSEIGERSGNFRKTLYETLRELQKTHEGAKFRDVLLFTPAPYCHFTIAADFEPVESHVQTEEFRFSLHDLMLFDFHLELISRKPPEH